jgi:hypothetical protein
MGRKPRQEKMKDYLENPGTTWLFSSPHQFQECFGDLPYKYITPVKPKQRLDGDTFRIVLHFPNAKHNKREEYEGSMKGHGHFSRYMKGGPLEASHIKYDSGSHASAQLILHTNKTPQHPHGKREEFFLTPGNRPETSLIYATASFPTMSKKWKPLKANTKDKEAVTDSAGNKGKWIKSEKLVSCAVFVGTLNVSTSKPGKFKLVKGKPKITCGKRLVAAGKAPKEWVKAAEGTEEYMNAESQNAFYAAQGLDNPIQDVNIMNSETEQQAIERAYYNPSEAMVGTDETLDGYRPIDSATVDLTSNQPMANYGAEGETATYSPSEEPDMVSSSSFDEPTNAHFSAHSSCMCKPVCKCAESCRCAESYGAEGETVADVEASVEPANEPIAVAEGTSLDGYAPLDSIEEGAPIGHGVNQFFGSAETVEGALLDESTTNIGIEEGVSLDNFSGVDSVVVEAPLGHGVTQWYAENSDGPQPPEPEGITGQDGPSATPTNEYMVLSAEFAADSSRYGKTLTQEEIDALPDSDFIYGGRRSYPIPNKGYGVRALSWANMASPKKKAHIRKVVHNKFPSLAAEGYDDKMDESLGERHRGRKQSFKDRRDEASAMDKRHSRMGRKYDDVMTMDAQGYDDKMDESLGGRHRGSHSQSFKDRRDEASAMDEKRGGRKYHDVGTMDNFNAIESGRDSKGHFTGRQWVRDEATGRMMGQGKRKAADTAGYLQDGSLSMDGYTPLESVDVDRTSYQPTQNYGAEFAGERFDTVKQGALLGVGAGATWGLGKLIFLTTASLLGLISVGRIMENDE